MSALERFAVNAAEKLEPVRRIAVLGAPINMGASQRGTLMGPAALRTAGLLALLESLGFGVTDHGDLTLPIQTIPNRRRAISSRCVKDVSSQITVAH